MLDITQQNAQVIRIHDSAVHNRLFALMFSLAGALLAYFSYPQLPDGNGFITGILLLLLGVIIFFTRKSYTIILDKHANTLFCISSPLLGMKKTITCPLREITEVDLQWSFDMYTAPSWLLYLIIDGQEGIISINANNSALSKKFSAFKQPKDPGTKVAEFLTVPFHQKKVFEN